MMKSIKEKIIDVTGIEITPGIPEECLGNGEHTNEKGERLECCCDECDYFLKCYPEHDEKIIDEILRSPTGQRAFELLEKWEANKKTI